MTSQLRVDKILPVDGAPTSGGGGIIQVVSDTKTDTQSFQSTNFQTITGLSVTITPKFNTSKIFIHYSICVGQTDYGMFNIRRNSTEILRGDAADSRTNCTFMIGQMYATEMRVCSGTILDSPSSTSALTYDVQCASPYSNSSQVFINRYKTDTDVGYVARTASTITAMEVSA